MTAPRGSLLLAAALLTTGAARAEPPVWVVHDEPAPMEELARVLRSGGHSVLVEEQSMFAAHGGEWNPKAVFFYVHGNTDPALESFLIRYAENGGRLIILHHGIASAKIRSKRWLPFAGIRILPRDHPSHPWKVLRGDVQVVNLNPSHYVTTHRVRYPETVPYTPSDSPSVEQQLPAFVLPDTEMFWNQHFTDGRAKTVLLGSRVEVSGKLYMQDRAGWLKPAGKGYVFYFQQGHLASDFRDPAFGQILVNAVQWMPPNR